MTGTRSAARRRWHAVAALALAVLVLLPASGSPAYAATQMEARCDSALRTRPWRTATIRTRIEAGTKVGVVAVVSGGRWKTSCGGSTRTGTKWYRIRSIAGTSVADRFGVRYLYVPKARLRPVDPWSVPFGSRPASRALEYNGNCPSVIKGRTFRDLGAGVIAIRIANCSNVTIAANDFINVAEGVLVVASTNIRVIDNRYQNILGPHERNGTNRGNFVQFDRVRGGLIDHNKGKGGDTEDVVSLHKSSGIVVEDNHFEGTNWTSSSGSGIAIGDGGGSDNVARRNVLVNIGQVGVYIAGGRNNRIVNNTVYGEQRENSNVGIYVWAQGGVACSNATVTGNKVRFRAEDGRLNGFWYGGGCGALTKSGNDFSAPLDVSTLRVSL